MTSSIQSLRIRIGCMQKIMNKLLLILGVTLLAGTFLYTQTTVDQVPKKFEAWRQLHNKRYSQYEQNYRMAIFEANLKTIEEVNAQNLSYQLGETQFMDLSPQEFEGIYLGGLDETKSEISTSKRSYNYPETADWSAVLNPVKNQAQCGSCWAFSAVGAFEAYFIVKRGQRFVLAEQQLNDCDSTSFGCDGGYAGYAIDYLNKNGAVLESDYPYVAVDQTCAKPKGDIKANGRNNIKVVDQVYQAISEYPVSVSVHASNWSLYKSGIFNNCINTSTNHAVVAVGYDAAGNWKVRNSWGATWGEAGHIRLAKGNTCGILNRVDQVI